MINVNIIMQSQPCTQPVVYDIKENMCIEQSQTDDQQFSFFKRSKGIRKEISARQTTYMAATFKGDRKLPHYQGQQLGKTHELCEKKKVPEAIISLFVTKGEHNVYFPLVFCSLMSLEHGLSFRQIAPLC